MMANMYDNMRSFVKFHKENPVMKRCHSKGVTLLSFFLLFFNPNFCYMLGISLNFGRCLPQEIMQLLPKKKIH